MTTAQLVSSIRSAERRGGRGGRAGDRVTAPSSRPRRTGMVSEAVVAEYIRELSGHGRRVRGPARVRGGRAASARRS
jgi:hypothetical protein